MNYSNQALKRVNNTCECNCGNSKKMFKDHQSESDSINNTEVNNYFDSYFDHEQAS